MVQKNFNIKQRAVNETPPMTGFQTQNLFKLSHEKQFRTKLMSDPEPLSFHEQDKASQIKNKRVTNIAMEMLADTDSDISEC